MRKVIAKRLVLSKTTIPHSYITATCVMDKIIALRKEMIANGQKVSLNDFIIKAAGVALKVNNFISVLLILNLIFMTIFFTINCFAKKNFENFLVMM